jgi:hypothetical protein
VWYWPRDPPRGFRETRAQDGGQVFGGYAVQVQVDCTQRLDRGPHGGSGWAASPAWEAPGGRGYGPAPASVRLRPEHRQSPSGGATPRMTAAAIAGRGAGPTPARRRRLGTKWESRALARALHSSIPLTCARVHLRKYEPDLVVAIGMHGWGSRGRRFKSNPDVPTVFGTPVPRIGNEIGHDRSHLPPATRAKHPRWRLHSPNDRVAATAEIPRPGRPLRRFAHTADAGGS